MQPYSCFHINVAFATCTYDPRSQWGNLIIAPRLILHLLFWHCYSQFFLNVFNGYIIFGH
uniref:Uncharacterized protein n=1 Tax=Rhizophora mucronata TaxID=61149 RepID=A0A2P2Q7H0_RHIMU